MNIKKHCFRLVVGALLVVAPGVALAGIVPTYADNPSQAFFAASNEDLVNTGQPSLASHVVSNFIPFADSDWQALNNGIVGGVNETAQGAIELETQGGQYTSMFTLDTSGTPLGYNITEIRTISAFNYDRGNQNYTLSYRTVDSPSFVTVGTFSTTQTPVTHGATQITLTDTSGAIAKNVDAIQVDWSRAGSSPLYREIDVFGQATPWNRAFRGTALTDDTDLIGSVPTGNFGNDPLLDIGAVGTRRALLRFDLSSVIDWTVEDAALRLTATDTATYGTFTNAPVYLYAVNAADADWEELVAAWSEKDPGTAPWSGGAGMGSPATFGTLVGSFNASSTDGPGHQYTIQFPDLTFLQGWLDDPGSNGGFLLYAPSLESGGGLIRVGSSNNPTLGNQPLLMMVARIPEPSTLVLLSIGLIGCLVCRPRREKK